MNVNNGWIKIHRKFTDWEWYKTPEMVLLFIHLLIKCNHAEKRWMGVTINRGQCITGRKKLAEETGLSEQTIRTCLHRLSNKSQELTIKSTNKFSIITICNYDSYQIVNDDTNQLSNQQLTNNQPTTNQQLTTNKNVKNVKNVKNIYSDAEKIKFLDLVTLTQKQHQTLIDKYGKSDTDKMIDMLNNYKASNGKKYKSDYHAILSWVKGEVVSKTHKSAAYKPLN